MKPLSEIPLGIRIYLLASAAFSSIIHVWYYEAEGSLQIRKMDWGSEGIHGVLTSCQQFIFMACAGLALYHLVKWLWSPVDPKKVPRTPDGVSKSATR